MSISDSTITKTKTNLDTQLRELERLRDQVKQAEMLARKSHSQSGEKKREIRMTRPPQLPLLTQRIH